MKKTTALNLSSMLQLICAGDAIYVSTKELETVNYLVEALSFQLPLAVTEYTAYSSKYASDYDDYELCPKCGLPLERTYQQYCDKCGQKLKWISKKKMIWKK